MSGCGTDIPTKPCQIKITFVNIGNKLKIKFNGMFSITLHNSNKQDSLTIVIISVSTLGMYRHGWPHMLEMWTFMDALNSFLRYFKDNANLLFYELWACWPCPSKIIASTCWKLWHLSAGRKSMSSLTSFLRYCKRYCKLLFWVLWTCLVKAHSKWWYKHHNNIINFITHFFLKML